MASGATAYNPLLVVPASVENGRSATYAGDSEEELLPARLLTPRRTWRVGAALGGGALAVVLLVGWRSRALAGPARAPVPGDYVQKFAVVTATSGGPIRLQAASDKCVDVQAGGPNVHIWSCVDGNYNQQFSLLPSSYAITNGRIGRIMWMSNLAAGGLKQCLGPSDDGEVKVMPCSEAPSFVVPKVSVGLLRLSDQPTKCWNVGGVSDGSRIQLQDCVPGKPEMLFDVASSPSYVRGQISVGSLCVRASKAAVDLQDCSVEGTAFVFPEGGHPGLIRWSDDSNMCLATKSTFPVVGDAVVLKKCVDGGILNQLFQVPPLGHDGGVKIVADPANCWTSIGSLRVRTKLTIGACSTSGATKFSSAKPGFFTSTSAPATSTMVVGTMSETMRETITTTITTSTTTLVVSAPVQPGQTQPLTIVPDAAGFYKITNAGNGKCLRAAGGDDTSLYVGECTPDDTHGMWQLVAFDGFYTLRSKKMADKYVHFDPITGKVILDAMSVATQWRIYRHGASGPHVFNSGITYISELKGTPMTESGALVGTSNNPDATESQWLLEKA